MVARGILTSIIHLRKPLSLSGKNIPQPQNLYKFEVVYHI